MKRRRQVTSSEIDTETLPSSSIPPTSQTSILPSSTLTSGTPPTSSSEAQPSSSQPPPSSSQAPPSSSATSVIPTSETSELPPTSTSIVVVTTQTTQVVTVTGSETYTATTTETLTGIVDGSSTSILDPLSTTSTGFGDPVPSGSDVSATGQDLPSVTSTAGITPTDSSGQMLTTTGSYMTYWTSNSNGVPITITQVIPQGTGALNSDTGGKGNDFFSNTAAVAGVFIVVGISCAAIILFGVFTWIRKRRAKEQRMDNIMASAIARQRRTPFDDGPEDDDTPSSNGMPGPEMGFVRSSGTPIPLYDPFRTAIHPGALQRGESAGSDNPYDPYRPPLANAPSGNGLNDTSPLSSNDHANGPPPPTFVGQFATPVTTALPAAYNNAGRVRHPSMEDAGAMTSPTDPAGPFEYDNYLTRTPSKGKYAPVSPLPPGAAAPDTTASGIYIGVQDPTPPHSPATDRNSYPYSPMAPAMALTTGPNSKPPSSFRQKRTSYPMSHATSPSVYSMEFPNSAGLDGERLPPTPGVPPEYSQVAEVQSGWYTTTRNGQLGTVQAGGSSVGHGSASNHSHSYSITYGNGYNNGSNFGWAENDDSNSDVELGRQTVIEVDQRLDPKSVLMARSKSGDALNAQLSPYNHLNKSDLSLGSLRDHEDYSRRVLQ